MKTEFYHRRELLNAARQAETLSNYRIEQIGIRFVVFRIRKDGREVRERVRTTHEAAVEYLFGKLPPIEGEL